MNPFPRFFLICALAGLLLLLPSCSGPSLREGMTQAEVQETLGPPLRVQRHAGGRESWYYQAIHRRRNASFVNNASLPGESVYERDLRLDTAGHVGGYEISTAESQEETPLSFGADGRLLATPTVRFLPRSEDG